MRKAYYTKVVRSILAVCDLGEAPLVRARNQRPGAEMADNQYILPKIPIFTFFVQGAG